MLRCAACSLIGAASPASSNARKPPAILLPPWEHCSNESGPSRSELNKSVRQLPRPCPTNHLSGRASQPSQPLLQPRLPPPHLKNRKTSVPPSPNQRPNDSWKSSDENSKATINKEQNATICRADDANRWLLREPFITSPRTSYLKHQFKPPYAPPHRP